MRILIFIGIFFVLLSIKTVAASDSTWLKIEVKTDNKASETEWELTDKYGSIIANSPVFSNNQVYTDSLWVPNDSCQHLLITDLGSNGIASPGHITIWVNNLEIITIQDFDESVDLDLNCREGESCLKPVALTGEGLFFASFERTWYTFIPDSTGIFSFSNCGKASCDTRIWVYDKCPNKLFDGAEGALAFNDDHCLLEAEVNTYLFKDSMYYVRLEDVDNSCSGGIFLTIIAERTLYGCLDTAACNYDPLANTSNGSCLYYPNADCHPDLQVNQTELENSIVLDKITVDSLDLCLLEEGCITGFGERDVIKFSTLIENIGGTDFYLGNPIDNLDLFNNTNCHGHYHYEGYADYFLIDYSGYRIPIGFKNGFCLMDSECDTSLPKFNCQTQGISSSCNDLYDFKTECQWIDITDIKDGEYTLVNRINGSKNTDAFGRYEVNYENNWAQICVEISRNSGVVNVDVLSSCTDFTDCNGVKFGDATIDCNGECNGLDVFGDLNNDYEVDITDLNYMQSLVLNENSTAFPCFDLNQNQRIDIADAYLVSKCALHEDSVGHSHNHPECVFPKQSLDNGETIEFEIMDINRDSSFIDVGVNTNGNFLPSYQFTLSGIDITSIRNLENGEEFRFDQNSVQYFDRPAVLNNTLQAVVRVYFKPHSGVDTIRISESQAIDDQGRFYSIEPTIGYYVLSNEVFKKRHLMERGIDLFPNPTNSSFTLNINPKLGVCNVEIINSKGVIITQFKSSNSVIIQTNDWQKGVYFVRCQNQNGSVNRRLTLQ